MKPNLIFNSGEDVISFVPYWANSISVDVDAVDAEHVNHDRRYVISIKASNFDVETKVCKMLFGPIDLDEEIMPFDNDNLKFGGQPYKAEYLMSAIDDSISKLIVVDMIDEIEYCLSHDTNFDIKEYLPRLHDTIVNSPDVKDIIKICQPKSERASSQTNNTLQL